MTILIGTPAYGGMVHAGYARSLLDFQQNGIGFALTTICNESLITRGRNTIISFFYEKREQFTHLLFIDADIELSGQDLKTLLAFDKDVVGACVPLKSLDEDGNPRYNIDGFGEQVDDHLYLTQRMGTAVMLLSRRAVEDLVEKAQARGDVYKNWTHYDSDGQLPDIPMYDVFQVGVVDGEYLSEDYWVCRELQNLGYDIHVTDSIVVSHYGMHAFTPKTRVQDEGD